PGTVQGYIGGVTNFIAWRSDRTCYGTSVDYQYAGYNPGWSCDNTSVATVDGNGQATAVGAGSTTINNNYYVDIYRPFIEDCILDSSPLVGASASCDVAATWTLGEVVFTTTTASPGNPGILKVSVTEGQGMPANASVSLVISFIKEQGGEISINIVPDQKTLT